MTATADPDEVSDLLAHPTHHKIIQMIFGHPANLASVEELVYMTGEDHSDVRTGLDALEENEIVDAYHYSSSISEMEHPATFYGFTEDGICILDRYRYLATFPMMRALYTKTKKDERIKECEMAPRPDLPDAVSAALTIEE